MTKKESKALVPAPTNAMEAWEAELEAEAAKARGIVDGIGGATFASLKGGRLKIGGNEVPGGEVAVVVLAYTNVKALYEDDFDPDEAASPTCFAIGDNLKTLAPHADCANKVNSTCQGCPNNDFGTARTGKGKACKDSIRLAFIEGGVLQGGEWTPPADIKALEASEVVTLAVPATSIGTWANYVRSLGTIYKRPPFAVYTKIKVAPHDKKQVEVTFECLGQCDKDTVPLLRKRVQGAEDGVRAPFPKREKHAPKAEAPKRRAKL